MRIIEAQEMKADLNDHLKVLLLDYEDKTGLMIESVDLEYRENMDDPLTVNIVARI